MNLVVSLYYKIQNNGMSTKQDGANKKKRNNKTLPR